MITKTTTKIVFTTDSIEDLAFIGYGKEEASSVFTAWLNENIEWITAGSELEAIEIIGVDYDLVGFNNQVVIFYLCAGCADDSCEKEDEVHEETVHACRFTETRFVEDWRN